MAMERSDNDSILMIMRLASTGGAITPPDVSATGFPFFYRPRQTPGGEFFYTHKGCIERS